MLILVYINGALCFRHLAAHDLHWTRSENGSSYQHPGKFSRPVQKMVHVTDVQVI